MNFRLSSIQTSLLPFYFNCGPNKPVHTATKSGRNLFDIWQPNQDSRGADLLR